MSSAFDAVVARVAAVLDPAGFQWSGEGFVRIRAEFVDCVGIQLRSDRRAFSINLGVQPLFLVKIDERSADLLMGMQEVDCFVRERLLPDGEADYWWSVSESEQSENQDFEALYMRKGEPFFDFFHSVEGAILPLSVECIENGNVSPYFSKVTRVRLALLAARASMEAGLYEKAKMLAEYGLKIAGMAVGPKKEFRKILEA